MRLLLLLVAGCVSLAAALPLEDVEQGPVSPQGENTFNVYIWVTGGREESRTLCILKIIYAGMEENYCVLMLVFILALHWGKGAFFS